jgi:membrane-bound serine protease (ClpP class)
MKISIALGKSLRALLFVMPLLLAATLPTSAVASELRVLTIAGPIHPASAEYLLTGIRDAAEADAQAVLVILDTPGGLLQSTREMVKTLLEPPLPVIFYVAPGGAEAASAGVFLVMAANVAAMAPGTSIGASTPVSAAGGEELDGAMGAKVMNSTVAFAKSIAEQRGRNIEWAERAVREAVSATDTEALALGVIDFIAKDTAELLVALEGRVVEIEGQERILELSSAEVVHVAPTFRQEVVGFLADPTIAYFLLLAGILGLYLEMSNPGGMVPGVLGAICLFVAAASFQILPINMSGLGLLVLGIGLLVAELFVPSFGILGLGGFAAFVLGSLYLFEAPEGGVVVDRGVIAGAAVAVGAVMLGMATLAVGTFGRQPVNGSAALIGKTCTIRDVDQTSGHVLLHGEIWAATWTGSMEVGDLVRVTNVEGLSVAVTRADLEKEQV